MATSDLVTPDSIVLVPGFRLPDRFAKASAQEEEGLLLTRCPLHPHHLQPAVPHPRSRNRVKIGDL